MAPNNKKYSEELHAQMVEMASKGATNAMLARACGIHPDTFQDWKRYAKQDPEKFPHLVQLMDDIEEARAVLAVEMTERVVQAANSGLPNTWQAAATYLERRYPDDWGRHEKRTVEGRELPQVNILVLNDPDARRAHQELLSRIAGDTTRPGEPIGSGIRGELEAGLPDE